MITRRMILKSTLICFACGALFTLVAATTTRVGVPKELADAREWVKTHRDKLPTAFGDFGNYPLATRKSIYATLSAKQKQQLWLEHLETFLPSGADLSPMQRQMVSALPAPLTDNQRAFIAEAVRELPRIFDPKLSAAEQKKIVGALCARSKGILSDRERTAIFGTVGIRPARPLAAPRAVAANRAGLAEAYLGVVRFASARVRRMFGQVPLCDCNFGSSCSIECLSQNCGCPGGPDCYECGCFWIWPCDGCPDC